MGLLRAERAVSASKGLDETSVLIFNPLQSEMNAHECVQKITFEWDP